MLAATLSRSTRKASRQAMLMRRVASFHASSFLASDLPYHIVVGLPALSPTMESGSLAEWYVSEGDSFSAGDVIAKIETDKASIDFEAQDDGNVAKLLMEPGNDIPVGTPIMITVEEADDVEAFKDYVHEVKEEPVKETETAPPKIETPPPKLEEPIVAQAPTPVVETNSPPPPVPESIPASETVASAPAFTVAWGLGAVSKSPMAKTLAAKQSDFIEKYGTSGQRPIL